MSKKAPRQSRPVYPTPEQDNRVSRFSRRDVLKAAGRAGAGLLLIQSATRGQRADIVLGGRPVEIVVSSVSPLTVRLSGMPIEGGVPTIVLSDGAVVREGEGRAIARCRSVGRFRPVRAGNLVVRFTSGPPTFHIETRSGATVQRLTLDERTAGMSFLLGKGPLLGLGEGGPQFDRKGSTDRMRSGQAGYRLGTHGGRVPIQWLVGTDGWGLFIHRPLGAFDFTGAEGRFAPEGNGLPLDVYIVSSSKPAEIMREYARITGLAEMPARWTLGYMQSHRTLAGPEEVMQVARTMREKKLPCDALIYLGTGFCPAGWNTQNGEFTWNRATFPDPKGTIDRLHSMHYRVVLHTVIEGRRLTGSVHDKCEAAQPEPSGRTPDGRWPDDRSVPCYWPYHKPLFDIGIDGWWPDQGDGYDAPSRLARIRMYWEGSQFYRPNQRPFALHRNGYAGMQRYGAFLWSGDVQSRWETLRTHVSVGVNAGLSGIPYWGTDIGGFIPTAEYTGELHVRWFQFGAFCTLFRAHGRHWHLRLPWGWDGGDGGPMETDTFKPNPAELKNAGVEPILRKYLELRYRMMPYSYTAVRECCETGLPIMRALWLHYPDDPVAVARGDQFLWGRDVLVSPIVEKGASSRRLYLPRGAWWDFWSEERIDGGHEIERKVDLETMPLHVRAGTILPLGPVRQSTEEPVDLPLTIVVYPGADGEFTLYEDDGETFNYRKGEWMRVEMRWQDAARLLNLSLARGSRMPAPVPRKIEVRVAGERTTKAVSFDGHPAQLRL